MNQLSPQLLGKGNLQGTRILFLISIENSGRCVPFTSTSQLQPHLPLRSCSQVLCPSLTLLFLHLPPSSTFLLPPAFFHIPTSKNLLRKKKQGTLTQFSSDLHDSSVREYTFLEMDSAPILAFPLPNSTQTSKSTLLPNTARVLPGKLTAQHRVGLTGSRPIRQFLCSQSAHGIRKWFHVAHVTQMRLQERTAGLVEETFSPF